MISIIEDVIECIRNITYPIENVNVREAYLNGVSLNPPLITVNEQPGNSGVYIDGIPNIVRNQFTIEYYAGQSIEIALIDIEAEDGISKIRTESEDNINSEQDNIIPLIPTKVGRTLLVLTDEYLERFGLTMIGTAQIAPYENPDIIRIVTNYYCYIDRKTKQIYRRINT